MAANIIDGKAFAATVREKVAGHVARLKEEHNITPGLAVVLVGEDAASQVYVRNKELAATKAGMKSTMIRLPEDATMDQVLEAVDSLNADETVDGFLVQLPLPSHLDEKVVTDRIDPSKDADGPHPTNLGRLLAGIDAPRPCTPSGCIELLKDEQGGLMYETGITTISFFKGDFKPAADALRTQFASVVDANPWLAGRLVKVRGGTGLRHPAAPSAADVDAMFTATAAADAAAFKLTPSEPYPEICSKMYRSNKVIVANGSTLVNQSLPTTLLTVAESAPGDFAVIFRDRKRAHV